MPSMMRLVPSTSNRCRPNSAPCRMANGMAHEHLDHDDRCRQDADVQQQGQEWRQRQGHPSDQAAGANRQRGAGAPSATSDRAAQRDAGRDQQDHECEPEERGHSGECGPARISREDGEQSHGRAAVGDGARPEHCPANGRTTLGAWGIRGDLAERAQRHQNVLAGRCGSPKAPWWLRRPSRAARPARTAASAIAAPACAGQPYAPKPDPGGAPGDVATAMPAATNPPAAINASGVRPHRRPT